MSNFQNTLKKTINEVDGFRIPKKLLSQGMTNAKTKKNKLKTFILYLAPYNQNSKRINICPHASKGCVVSCLFSAGRGKFSNVVKSRINKTEYFLKDKTNFLHQLHKEIIQEYYKAKKRNYKIAIRLNGTSDLDFLHLLRVNLGFCSESYADNLVFYDYTKDIKRAMKYKDFLEYNYKLTFSRSEANSLSCDIAIKNKINVAVVFEKLPYNFNDVPVINGDTSDDLMLNYSGIILGLKAKGDARTDKSGFVISKDNLKCNYDGLPF